MRGLVAAFMAEVALISWRNLHNVKQLPPPSQYTGAAIIYGLLGLLPQSAGPAAAAMGWALVVATFINLWNPQTPLNVGNAFQPTSYQGSASQQASQFPGGGVAVYGGPSGTLAPAPPVTTFPPAS